MAVTKATTPATPAASAAPAKKSRGTARNYDLGNGIYRFSRSRMFHKKATYKFIGKKTPKDTKPKKPLTVEKKINGDKNGGTRTVRLVKRRASYATQDPVTAHHGKKCFRDHSRYVRPSLVKGTVCILLAGVHKGKRVVFLKALKSGLLLVNGPFLINGCPLRRVSQNYVIATATRINIEDKIPAKFDDDYFKRKREKRAKKEEGDIFAQKKEEYKASDERKADQKVVDKIVIDAIKKNQDKKMLYTYLSAMFGLRSSQYPHRMKF